VLHLVEVPEAPVSPFPQPAEVPLDGRTTLGWISHSSQFGVVSKLVEGMLCHQTVNEDVKQDWTQYQPPGHTAGY